MKKPTKQPTNEFDVTCRDHDVELANAVSTNQVLAANDKFYASNIGQGTVRSIAAVLVKHFYPFSMPKNQKTKSVPQKGSGSTPTMQQIVAAIKKAVPPPKINKKKMQRSAARQSVIAAPVSIGTTIRGQSQSVSYGRDTVSISGRDFICAVGETNQTNWYLGAIVPVNPSFFSSASLARLGQSYRFYRFKRLTAHFITRQPTSSTGEIIIVQHPNPSKELWGSQNTTFLPRVMSSKASVMGPVWTNHSLSLKVDGTFREVDGMSNSDIDDNILGELVVYVQSAISDVVGYLMFDYEVEFKEMYINEQASSMPLSFVFDQSRSDDTANEVAGAQMLTLLPSAFGGYPAGTVFKAILNSTASAYATGTTNNTALALVNRTNSATLSLADGFTFYAVIVGTNLMWYPTLESAISQTDSVFVAYNLSVAYRAQWYFTYWLAQWGNATKV